MKRTYSTVADFASAVRKLLESEGRLPAEQAKWLIERPAVAALLATAFDLGSKLRPTYTAVMRTAVADFTRTAVAKAA